MNKRYIYDRDLMSGELTRLIFERSQDFLSALPREEKKNLGQFTTSPETAEYMASMFSKPTKEEVSILDPGAGSGILSAALIDRLVEEGLVKSINLTCYENDQRIVPLLIDNLHIIRENVRISFTFCVKNENYILKNADSFNGLTNEKEQYDLIISNPPYKKIPKEDPEAACMQSVCSGFPNKYFIFMALSIHNLSNDGELVYIIPRSWTSGKYFRAFRDYLFSESEIKQMHIFVSRDKVFESETVLQETMIVKLDKKKTKGPVLITSTENNHDFNNVTSLRVPYDTVIQGKEQYVFLITTEDESEVVEKIGRFSQVMPDIGIKMKTGIVVDFRAKEFIVDAPDSETVPYIQATHIGNGSVEFPKHCTGEYLERRNKALIQPNCDYLFVKRFTTKEEKRRLQTSVYLSDQFPEYNSIATDNKINFITGVKDNLTPEEVYGLYVIFNSTLYDQYYRILNGSTQVNSSEVNNIPVPPRKTIEKMGAELILSNDFSTKSCDIILEAVING